MTLTIALQNEMKAIIDKNGNIVIDIPDTCKRDPICKNTKIDGGFLRVIRNKIKHVRNNY